MIVIDYIKLVKIVTESKDWEEIAKKVLEMQAYHISDKTELYSIKKESR